MTSLRLVVALALLATVGACASPSTTSTSRAPAEARTPSTARPVDPQQAQRLQRVMVPLIRAMNNARPLDKVRVGIMDDPHLNAASAGNGEFYVTRGLLEKANDEQLAGVLAHEIAHDDLNHVAKAQALGAGLNIGMVILDQLFPGSGALTPIAGTLIARKYGQNEEYAADRHGMDILKRAGMRPEIMPATLAWLMRTEGSSSGGFFATHPATTDRIEALKRLTQR